MLATGIRRLLGHGDMIIQLTALVVSELPMPTPLHWRCAHNQARRLRMHGREAPFDNVYEGV